MDQLLTTRKSNWLETWPACLHNAMFVDKQRFAIANRYYSSWKAGWSKQKLFNSFLGTLPRALKTYSDVYPSKEKKAGHPKRDMSTLGKGPFISWLADKKTTEALVQNTQDWVWNRLCESLWCFHASVTAFISWAHLLLSMKHMGQTQTLMLRVPSRRETLMVSSFICKASITFLGHQTHGPQGPQGLYKIQTMPYENSDLKKK